MNFNVRILEILIIPSIIALIGIILYANIKKSIVSKLLAGSLFLILSTWMILFVILPLMRGPNFYPQTSLNAIAIGCGAVGYPIFFISLFILMRKLIKEEREKKLKDSESTIDHIGK